MNLLHLKIACYLYNQLTNNDESYTKFTRSYPNINFNENNHIKALIKWLRIWGCRQFKINDEAISIENLIHWHQEHSEQIPINNKILDYDLEANKHNIISIFNTLSGCQAANRQINNTNTEIHIGHVGASKILSVLVPHLFAAWDNPIIQHLILQPDGENYVKYLSKIQDQLNIIKNELSEENWNNIFNLLSKAHNFYPKLIDEYYWVTITKKFDLDGILSVCRENI